MSEPKTTASDPVMEELARNLTRLYNERGASYREIERALLPVLGPEAPTAETIRQYHFGNVSRGRANVLLLAAICGFYGVRIADVSAEFAERAASYQGVLTQSGWSEPIAGQELCDVAA